MTGVTGGRNRKALTARGILSDYFHHLQGKAPPGQPPAVPITARTTWDGKVIGNKAPNARLVTADKAPRLGLGAKDEAMGGWVTFAEHKLGVAANGYFGPEMVEAVKRLQRSRRLPVTGKIDAKTWRSLGQPL
jgi:peptidoglycan hydrolase-like protein with peptidoglycan-binding domain